ncbi:hypothetical protein [Agreia bicolorata]|uniref:Uncharacterized protein n=1 Tax=Agreia bicolorata TaxID=110935 RepID=A0ABR5CBT2_9MICO|nr:hypothetical protein [Agreia bicolorata]KJC63085.1 hypothetical protein TZ00_17135 [Agreia bicolorata]
MSALFAVMVAAATASVVLSILGRSHGGRTGPVFECVMLLAMVDVHAPGLGVVPAPLWCVLLTACAIGGAFVGRLQAAPGARPAIVLRHSAGMLVAALLVLIAGTTGSRDAPLAVANASGIAHAHGAAPSSFLVTLVVVAVVAYAIGVVAVVLHRRPARIETARCFSSLLGLVAMAGMVAVPVLH